MKKLISTLRITINLAMARTFGEYKHSGYDGKREFSIYRWRGNLWQIPLTPEEIEE